MNMTDDELVEQLRVGEDSAFEALYERYAVSLLRHLLTLMGSHQEAEDMLHETMLLMIQKINFYTPRSEMKQSFKAWLFRLGTNRAIDEIRKRKRKVDLDFEVIADTSEAQEDLYLRKEDESLLNELMDKLPLMQRMLLGLRVVEDLSYLEISVICGKDVNSIKQGLFQARKSMKHLLIQRGVLL